MRKPVKRILSLVLVIAVLMSSMLVSSVGAKKPVTIDPMQTVLLDALSLNTPKEKEKFIAALDMASAGSMTCAVNAMLVIFPTMKRSDVESVLSTYKTLTVGQKTVIKVGISAFDLNEKSYDGNGFDTIIDKVNEEITGKSKDNKGISLIVQIIEKLNRMNQKGAWTTDLSSDISKIEFKYNSQDLLINLAIEKLNTLIGMMETLNGKLVGRTEATVFDKLLGYTAGVINTAPSTEITALKSYLNGINDSYYVPYVVPGGGGGGGGGGTTPEEPPETNTDVIIAFNNLIKAAATATGLEINALEKALAATIVKAAENVGTITVTPKISGTNATITADQIKDVDILAKADAVIAKAAELEKIIAGSNVNVERKIVINVAANNIKKVRVELPTELLIKVKEKGIQNIEIATGDVKINIAPDFEAGIKSSSSIAFEVNKVAISDELKATMTAEQKTILESNPTVYELNAMLISSTGSVTKLTNFDKLIKIRIKYTLKAGENKDSLTVLFLGDNGKIQNMTGRYNQATGEIEFETNHFSKYVVKNLVKSFNDIPSSAWYKSEVESLAAKGIVVGIKGNNFKPNQNITRAEFLAMLVKAKGIYDSAATCHFTDVSKGAWYYSYVASAVNAGIASGVGKNKFAPNSLITREQMAVMIANALGVKTVDNASSYLTFKDANKIAAYAKNSMALCVKNEFIVGSHNKLDPKGKATRAMAAVVVYKYFNFIY